jgi:hypothetical protein
VEPWAIKPQVSPGLFSSLLDHPGGRWKQFGRLVWTNNYLIFFLETFCSLQILVFPC